MIGHDVLTYSAARTCGLRARVRITDFTNKNADTEPLNPDYVPQMREGGRPTVDSRNEQYDENEYYGDYVRYSAPTGGEVDALEVLALYSAEPDWGMDSGLSLSAFQGLTGGSQGYRHLDFHLFSIKAGCVAERARYYHGAAQRVKREGDDYWTLRFAARALHYMEDCLTPVHQKPFTEGFFLRNLPYPGTLQTVVSNYHLNYERMVGWALWHGEQRFIGAIKEAKPLVINDLVRDLRRQSLKARRLFYPLFGELEKIWPSAECRRLFKIGAAEAAGLALSEPLAGLTCSWLSLSSGFVKGYVEKYVMPSFREKV